MATINLGAIKFNWKGSYSGATAYVVDDVVESSGSSYICIAATTGNAPPNATYWEQMSSAGTNGTDGTDLTTTLTTQGDIVYRNASGLARLGAGTSGQVLQTNGTGANPSWGTVSSDFVKIATVEATSDVASLDITQCFSTDYDFYKIQFGMLNNSSTNYFEPAFLDSSNNVDTTTYSHKHSELYGNYTTISNGQGIQTDTDGFRIMNSWYQNDSNFWGNGEINVTDPLLTHQPKHMWYTTMTWSQGSHIGIDWGVGYQESSTPHYGIRFRCSGGNIKAGFRANVYGLKN